MGKETHDLDDFRPIIHGCNLGAHSRPLQFDVESASYSEIICSGRHPGDDEILSTDCIDQFVLMGSIHLSSFLC
jgi:hypothetical protein